MITMTMLQAGTVNAMLAGIVIESVGAPLFRGPYYSIINALGAVPHKLLSAAQFRSTILLSFSITQLFCLKVW